MYKSYYRMSNTEQVATVGPQMVVGIRYRNEVAAATSHNHRARCLIISVVINTVINREYPKQFLAGVINSY